MAKKFAVLQRMDNDHEITKDSDHAFLFHLQNGLLQALKEQGVVSEIQLLYSEEKLRQWYRGPEE